MAAVGIKNEGEITEATVSIIIFKRMLKLSKRFGIMAYDEPE